MLTCCSKIVYPCFHQGTTHVPRSWLDVPMGHCVRIRHSSGSGLILVPQAGLMLFGNIDNTSNSWLSSHMGTFSAFRRNALLRCAYSTGNICFDWSVCSLWLILQFIVIDWNCQWPSSPEATSAYICHHCRGSTNCPLDRRIREEGD